jgi:hypothetical protein
MPDTGDPEYGVRMMIAPLFGQGVSADDFDGYLILGRGHDGAIYVATAMNFPADRIDLMCRAIRVMTECIPGAREASDA